MGTWRERSDKKRPRRIIAVAISERKAGWAIQQTVFQIEGSLTDLKVGRTEIRKKAVDLTTLDRREIC